MSYWIRKGSVQNSKRSILIICYFYAPFLNPRAIRWTAIAEQWAKDGVNVCVVSSWSPGLARRETVNGVRVFRTGGSIIERLRVRLISRSSRAASSQIEHVNKPTSSRIRSSVGRIIRFIHDMSWKKVYWPDSSCLWTHSAIRESSRLVMREKILLYVTVSDPYTSHLAGLALSHRYPNMRWLVDIGDPFSFEESTPPNNHRIYRRLNHLLESKVFKRAAHITVTNAMTRDKYAELFQRSSGRISVIHPVISPPDPGLQPEDYTHDGRFRAVYVGTLYRKIRNPAFLLKLFSTFIDEHPDIKLDLHFYGAVNDCQQCFEPFADLRKQGRLVLHGPVSRKKVFSEMQKAGLLVNIGNDSPYQLPSKIVEYASLGKPILNIAGIHNDSSTEFLRDYHALLNIFDDGETSPKKHASRLKDFISRCPALTGQKTADEFGKRFGIESISAQYMELLFDHR